MTTKSNSVLKYAGAVMAVGGTAMLSTALMSGGATSFKKKAKKTVNKAIDAMDTMLTNVQNMVK